jgi:IclR family transcriptional regulator, blcABC operon repressor
VTARSASSEQILESAGSAIDGASQAVPADANADRELPDSLAPAVTRAAAILDELGAAPSSSLGTSELARRLGLPKSSIANICGALLEAGLLRRAGAGFALGRRLAELGGVYLASIDPVQEFYLACDELADVFTETIQLGVLDGNEITYIARHDGSHPIRLTSEIGRRLPASCTAMGKATLATLSADEFARRYAGIRWLPSLTSRSHRTVESLRADVEQVHQRGYAVDDEETADGVVCYGVAFRGRRSGEGPYAVSATLLKISADERRDDVIADLRRLARMLSDPLRRTANPRSM